jgi:hypothetical protein
VASVRRVRCNNPSTRAGWARLIQKVYEVDPLECPNGGATMRIIALIDNADVIERILKHAKVWDPQPEIISPVGPDPPRPRVETLPITYHPVLEDRLMSFTERG